MKQFKFIQLVILITIGAPSLNSFCEELSVIGVKNKIQMSDGDSAYQDFYIAGGDVSQLKPNTVVTAIRKISVQDATGTKNFGEVQIPVGELKVIFSNNNVAVARVHKLISRENAPVLDDSGVMIGDLLDMSSAKKVSKK